MYDALACTACQPSKRKKAPRIPTVKNGGNPGGFFASHFCRHRISVASPSHRVAIASHCITVHCIASHWHVSHPNAKKPPGFPPQNGGNPGGFFAFHCRIASESPSHRQLTVMNITFHTSAATSIRCHKHPLPQSHKHPLPQASATSSIRCHTHPLPQASAATSIRC